MTRSKSYIDWHAVREELRANGLLAAPDKGIKLGNLWLWPLRPETKRRERTWIGGSA